MFFELKINFSAFFDGITLPKKLDKDPFAIFYTIVFKQNSKVILRKNFDKNTPNTMFYIFFPMTRMSKIYLKKSTDQVVGRMRNQKDPIFVHVYKILRDGNIIGIIRNIARQSSRQDMPMYRIDLNNPKSTTKITVRKHMNQQEFTKVPTLKIYEKSFKSPTWYTQRNFYSTCHYDLTMEAQEKNLTKIVNYLIGASKKKTFDNALDFLLHFGAAITKRIHYMSDTEFGNIDVNNDRGDAKLDFSHWGDCEDFAHYFMRMFRLLMDVYDKVEIDKKSSVYRWIKYVKLNYVPLIYVCRVKLKGVLQYHATLLFIRKHEGVQNISFEVTDQKDKEFSMVVYGENSTFYTWHIESYFLVDGNFISRINHKEIHSLTFDKILDASFNY